MPPVSDDERDLLMSDAKTATLAGGGLGFGVLGVIAVPILSLLGLALCFFALRTVRPGYRTGRIFAIIGLALNGFGIAMWITLYFMRGT